MLDRLTRDSALSSTKIGVQVSRLQPQAQPSAEVRCVNCRAIHPRPPGDLGAYRCRRCRHELEAYYLQALAPSWRVVAWGALGAIWGALLGGVPGAAVGALIALIFADNDR